MQGQKNLVSIIVPCYNLARYLPDCINSVIQQTYKYFECIIVNDGSTDNTIDVAMRYVQLDSRIKLINIKNGGLSNARNVGIRSSSGEYLLPLDADDIIDEKYLELAVNVLDNNPNTEIVYCKAKYFGKRHGEFKLHPYSLEYILGNNCIFCSAFYRRVTYDKTSGYNSSMKYGFEDWDFWLSILELGGEVYKIDEVLFFYRQRHLSMRTRNVEKDRLRYTRKLIYENHKDLYSKHFFNPEYSLEYIHYAQSPEYKLGKILLFPIRKIYSWL
jgi:glycosyltransferase involved in cell wall biosynthesis